jgi:hypothetical protein
MEECWSTATHDRPSTDKVAQVISDEFDSLSSSANGREYSDEDVSFIDSTLSFLTSVVQNVASAAATLPSHHQRVRQL